MTFSLGDILSIEGNEYRVAGRISYKDPADGCRWDEYKLFLLSGGGERWLSIDEGNQEYSIWEKAFGFNTSGYHQSDQGVQIVTSACGNVDVDPGERASYIEYEDVTEELILSMEKWEDETEYSAGHYLDADEIIFVRNDPTYAAASKSGSSAGGIIMFLIFLAFAAFTVFPSILNEIEIIPTIAKYLKRNAQYSYVTSITGNDNQKADVYSAPSGSTQDSVVREIIEAIHGKTSFVQQDSEEKDGAVAILTDKEYCLVYISSDGPVLIQVSNRKYAYSTDDDVYHGTKRTRHYYRSFYYTTGYDSDASTYSNIHSPYSNYDGGTIDYSSSDTYNSYSGSVRQSSIDSRQSSGGGLSSGK